jgi:hypothetical protein
MQKLFLMGGVFFFRIVLSLILLNVRETCVMEKKTIRKIVMKTVRSIRKGEQNVHEMYAATVAFVIEHQVVIAVGVIVVFFILLVIEGVFSEDEL